MLGERKLALRVTPAETWLTVYRWLLILVKVLLGSALTGNYVWDATFFIVYNFVFLCQIVAPLKLHQYIHYVLPHAMRRVSICT